MATPNKRMGEVMGGSILVVEDEAAIRDLLAANLQRAGYRVMTAGDVPQAEALVRESRPDLVLLDWVLPGVPGLTFARRLRGDQRTKDISIVLLSARAEEKGAAARRRRGGDRRPAHRSGLAPGQRRGEAHRPVDHGAAPAALLHDAPGTGFLARAPAGRGLGRARVRRGAHGRRAHPAAAPGAGAHRTRQADRDGARDGLPLQAQPADGKRSLITRP